MSSLNKTTYNLIAKNYGEDHGKRLPWHQELEAFAAELTPNPVIIDLGCGPGREAIWLASAVPGSHVTGVDFSEEMIALAAQSAPNNAAFLTADISAYRHPAPADGVWARGSLHHLSDEELLACFHSISSYLKPTGIVCCVNKQGTGNEIETADKYGGTIQRYFNFFTVEKLEGLAAAAGLEHVRSHTRSNDGQNWLISFVQKR